VRQIERLPEEEEQGGEHRWRERERETVQCSTSNEKRTLNEFVITQNALPTRSIVSAKLLTSNS
jgi:hypothetical protein